MDGPSGGGGAGHGLQNHGLVDVDEQVLREISLDVGGEDAHQSGLLEQRIWSWMNSLGEDESPSMKGLQEAFERHEAGPGVGLLKQLGVSLEGVSWLLQTPMKSQISLRNGQNFGFPSRSC